jgi:hypothetical protein
MVKSIALSFLALFSLSACSPLAYLETVRYEQAYGYHPFVVSSKPGLYPRGCHRTYYGSECR